MNVRSRTRRASASSPVRIRCEAEIALRADVRGRQLDRPPRERDRLVKPIVTRGEIAGDAIDLAEGGIDLQNCRRLSLERRPCRRARRRWRRAATARRDASGLALRTRRCAPARRRTACCRGRGPPRKRCASASSRSILRRFFGGGRGHRRVLAGERTRRTDVCRRPVGRLP